MPKPSGPLPSVSVVIPCLDGEATIGEQLDAIARQTYPTIEVIVADNGSADQTRAIVRGHEGVRLVDASRRRGPNHARNVGASHANGDLILLCDSDDVAHPGWVAAMAEALGEYDLVGGVLDYERLNPPDRIRPAPRRPGEPKHGFLPTASGANFGIRREVLEALGGWDESFDGGPDDTELCWRAQLAGYRLGFVEDAVIHYRLRTNPRTVVSQAFGGGVRIPQLVRTFRGRGMPYRGLVRRGLSFGLYILAAWPLAIVSRRHRIEWLRRVSLGLGLARGLLRTPNRTDGGA